MAGTFSALACADNNEISVADKLVLWLAAFVHQLGALVSWSCQPSPVIVIVSSLVATDHV